jgi:DNA replication and repair protein RecF
MTVTDVKLRDFRNYAEADVSLSPGVNVLSGLNGQGKTNFLEALGFLSNGASDRAVNLKELIRFGRAEARAEALVKKSGFVDKIEAEVSENGKRFYVNGCLAGKLGDLFGALYTVRFSPEDLRLIKSGPAERRRFADITLCGLDAVYYYDLRRYYRALKHRNSLLKKIKEGSGGLDELEVWDFQLAEYGVRIIKSREIFVEKIKAAASGIYEEVSGGEVMDVSYKPNVSADVFYEKLRRGAERDAVLGTTGAGAHKDDIHFCINGREARLFASQGQCKTAAVALKLSEIEIIRKEKNEDPVLLLDDVLSELDGNRQARLIEGIRGAQAVVTLTGAEGAFAGIGGAKRFKVSGGAVCEE